MNDQRHSFEREREAPLNDHSHADTLAPSRQKAAARRRGLLLLGGAVALAALAYGGYELLFAGSHETTDDAYVAGDVTQVTARDAGTVIAVHAEGTQAVKAGQPLVDLDPALADAALASAEADLARAVRQVRSGFSRVDTAQAEIAEAQTRLAAAQSDLSRRQQAVSAGAVSGEEAAHAGDAVKAAQASLALAQSHRADALTAIDGTDVTSNPAVLAAIAAVKRAAIVRGHMHIAAPIDGVVANRAVQLGQQVAPGSSLMSIVPLMQVWVDANFRETQLADLRMGQPVTLKSDAWGGDVTYHGKIIGMNAGSGSAFALLPAQNASGNWIKIVQRVPVRIGLDPKELAAHPLRIGLSLTVDVDTANRSGPPILGGAARQEPAVSADQVGPEVEARIRQIIATNSGAGAAHRP
ncbi:MAG TPA: efflux RND transporter periplasmic adaptor subunit [Novosphingobium sp.]|nr:efflux RND transporter periplasmic adaptor subunit [Novosphingobium sp.]